MTRAIGVLSLGLLAVVLQGAVASVVAPPWCPDFALLVVLAIGLRWEGMVSGLAIVSALGYAADVVSGGLRGAHALLWVLVFISARLAARQLNLRGAIPLASFAAGLSVVYGLALVALTLFFRGAGWPSWGWWDQLPHAFVNALAAPFVLAAVGRILGWLSNDDEARQVLSLESGRRVS